MLKHERVPVNGILLLDKPRGFTSNQCLQQVKRLFNAKKAGHTGTLDPIATGILPIALGEATKFIEYAHEAAKAYRATAILGEQRDTGDVLGEVVATAAIPAITEAAIAKVLAQFTGVIQQVPPMFSALKHQGKRLYDLARQGVEVERPAREVTIYSLKLLELNDTSFSIEVSCSKGTYIRTLLEDLAQALGTKAYMSELCRTESAGFNLAAAISLESLKAIPEEARASQLLAIDSFLHEELPSVELSQAELKRLYCGQLIPNAAVISGVAKIYCREYGFHGLVEATPAGEWRSKKLLAAPFEW